MFVTTPEIVWHEKDPVFGVDFHSNGLICRLATAGADQTVKLWKVLREDDKIKIVFLASLERHTKSVNTIRFSPNGCLLASAGDDCVVCLWKLSDSIATSSAGNIFNVEDEHNKENWTLFKMLRGHLEDVYDLSWSNDSKHLVSGSVDNSAIVWDTSTGEKVSILKDSHHYIQGVAWGSTGFLATLGTDRVLRIYDNKFKCIHSVLKSNLNEDKAERLFHDESMSSFFRRLTFSPDGLLLLAPGGKVEHSNVTWIFTLPSLPKPVLYLPAGDKPSLAVRFSPLLYQLLPNVQSSLFDLPYRMIFAVATMDTVIVYDTQQIKALAIITDIHYTSLTDLAWSSDGSILMVSSTDGYCTAISMSQEEMGVPYTTGISRHDVSPDYSPVNISHTSTSSTYTDQQTIVLSQHQRKDGDKTPRRVNFVTLSNDATTDNKH